MLGDFPVELGTVGARQCQFGKVTVTVSNCVSVWCHIGLGRLRGPVHHVIGVPCGGSGCVCHTCDGGVKMGSIFFRFSSHCRHDRWERTVMPLKVLWCWEHLVTKCWPVGAMTRLLEPTTRRQVVPCKLVNMVRCSDHCQMFYNDITTCCRVCQ